VTSARHDDIAVAVLAAGESRRMNGRIKQILPWTDGTLIRHAISLALQAGFSKVLVVLGYASDTIAQTIADMPVEVIVNDEWEEGVASSVRAAVASLPDSVQAVMFLPVDQPGMIPDVLRRVADRFVESGSQVVYARYGGVQKQPVLFGRSLFPELMDLVGDEGGRVIVRRHLREALAVDVEDPLMGKDIDTWEDYAGLARELGLDMSEED
jgi:molybdenum cofactor cytidylyltransferase